MDHTQIEAIARKVFDANANRLRFEPLRGTDEPGSLDIAYDIQDALYRIMQSEGHSGPVGGHKIAITSPDIQELCGVDQPIYGSIFAKTIHRSPHVANMSDFIRLGIEFEVAFELGSDVPASKAPFDSSGIAAYVKAAMPAFELIEDRNADYSDLDAKSLLVDRCWCGGVVLGAPVEDWQALDLGNLTGTARHNDVLLERSNTGNALGHPLNGLAWIANHLAQRDRGLLAGEIVMTGSALKTRFLQAGDRYTYEIEGLGEVSMRASGQAQDPASQSGTSGGSS